MDLQTLQQEHEELQAELRASTERAKKASCEVTGFIYKYPVFIQIHTLYILFPQLARVGEELRLEQEHTLLLEKAKKGLEGQIKDMSGRLDEAEQMALKGGKKIIQKLEGKVWRHLNLISTKSENLTKLWLCRPS